MAYETSLAGLDEPECITCMFRQRYKDLQDQKFMLAHGEPTFDEARVKRNHIAGETEELLEIADEIARRRCEGNYVAAQAVFN